VIAVTVILFFTVVGIVEEEELRMCSDLEHSNIHFHHSAEYREHGQCELASLGRSSPALEIQW